MKKVFLMILLFASIQGFSQEFKLTESTKKGLEEIKLKIESKEALDAVLGISFFYSVFGSGPSLEQAYSISTTDWELFGKAFEASGKITRASINKVIDFQILHHWKHQPYHKEDKDTVKTNLKFWQNMKKNFE